MEQHAQRDARVRRRRHHGSERINVDGAARDLANVSPRLKIGGVIVFDDIRSAPRLACLREWYVKDDAGYRAWEYTEAGAGIAAAVRGGP